MIVVYKFVVQINWTNYSELHNISDYSTICRNNFYYFTHFLPVKINWFFYRFFTVYFTGKKPRTTLPVGTVFRRRLTNGSILGRWQCLLYKFDVPRHLYKSGTNISAQRHRLCCRRPWSVDCGRLGNIGISTLTGNAITGRYYRPAGSPESSASLFGITAARFDSYLHCY